MSDPLNETAAVLSAAGEALNATTWFNVAQMALRVLHDAPALVDAVANFWNAVGGNNSPPSHVNAAVQAAIADVKEKTPTTHQ